MFFTLSLYILFLIQNIQSTYYQNATSAKTDSERGVAAVIQTIVTQELAKLSVPKGVVLSSKDTESITAKAVAAIKAKEGEFGVKLLGLEFRMLLPWF